jgi:hypothetical protein
VFKRLHDDIRKASTLTYIIILLGSWQFGEIMSSIVSALLKGYGLIK